MKKALSLLVFFCMAANAHASTGESQSFVFDGKESTKQLTLHGSKSHTEYQTQTISKTCYHQVLSGHQQQCEQVPHTVCSGTVYSTYERPKPPGAPPPPSHNPPSKPPPSHNPPSSPPSHKPPPSYNPPPSHNPPSKPPPSHNPPSHPPTYHPPSHNPGVPGNSHPLPPGPPPPPSHNPPSHPPYKPPPQQCHTVWHTECHDVPYYTTEAYTCYENSSVPVEVQDYAVTASVLFNFGQLPAGLVANEQIKVSLNGDQVSVSLKDSKKIAFFATKTEQEVVSGGQKDIAVTYNIEMASASELLAPISKGITSISIDQNDVLRFNVGLVEHPDTFQPHLRLKNDGNVLIERDLQTNEYQLTSSGQVTTVTVDLKALGVAQKIDKDHSVKLKITSKLVVAGSLLNPSVLPSKKEVLVETKLELKP